MSTQYVDIEPYRHDKKELLFNESKYKESKMYFYAVSAWRTQNYKIVYFVNEILPDLITDVTKETLPWKLEERRKLQQAHH